MGDCWEHTGTIYIRATGRGWEVPPHNPEFRRMPDLWSDLLQRVAADLDLDEGYHNLRITVEVVARDILG